jgi:hypothetical protein
MRGVSYSLVLLAASIVIVRAEPAAPLPDQLVSFSQEMLTYAHQREPQEMNAEPGFKLDSNLQFDGLLVDCFMPQETWNMLDPSVPVLHPQEPVPPSLLPVTAPRSLSNPAVHEADFAVLRLSFP